MGVARANVPVAYFACEGADDGASCDLVGGTVGNCVRDTLCQSPPGVDQCLLCVDGCWAGLDSGALCTQLGGAEGRCAFQGASLCTGRDETSFNECMRCTPLRCAGSQPGAPCVRPYGGTGTCAVDAACDPATEACLRCVDACQGGKALGDGCQRADGTGGVCERIDCVDDPSTSFDECLRCAEGELPTTKAASDGCSLGEAPITGAIWLLLALVALVQLRRPALRREPRGEDRP